MNNCELHFYQCKVCGKIIAMVKDSGTPTICCGEAMAEIKPKMNEEFSDRHLPAIRVSEGLVTVTAGPVMMHPEGNDHYIEWIILQTNKGLQHKIIGPNKRPVARFLLLPDEKVVAAYDYCNIHKLWKSVLTDNN